MVHGDRRNYLTALLGLAHDETLTWAKANGLEGMSYEELTKNQALYQEVERIVDGVNQHLARFETIKRFSILPRLLEVEQGELTPTLKVRRSIVEENYKALLDSLYAGE